MLRVGMAVASVTSLLALRIVPPVIAHVSQGCAQDAHMIITGTNLKPPPGFHLVGAEYENFPPYMQAPVEIRRITSTRVEALGGPIGEWTVRLGIVDKEGAMKASSNAVTFIACRRYA
jgi:hypothetical protein